MMNILVACEESGRVAAEFRKRGHNAYSCDILETSGNHPEWHIVGDVTEIINGECFIKSQTTRDGYDDYIKEWDMIIAFPPCTYFTTAGACRMYHKDENGKSHIDQERFTKMAEMRKLFYAIYNADCEKIVIENPTPMKICALPEPTQIIQPFMFGEPWTKRTLLWVKGLPMLKPTNVVEPINGSWVNGDSSIYRKGIKPKGKTNAKDRSKTFYGIAKAMAEQWG